MMQGSTQPRNTLRRAVRLAVTAIALMPFDLRAGPATEPAKPKDAAVARELSIRGGMSWIAA